jgi:glycosyltransferase involved in cell wall biosynthesis
MHILLIPSWYPTAEDPIRGSFFAEQAEALTRYGHRVSVAALFGGAERGVRTEITRRGEVTEYRLHYAVLPMHLTFVRIARALIGLFSTAFRGDRPDIIHVHSFGAIRYARLISALYRIPFVVTEHVSWFERGLLSEKDLRAIAADYRHAAAVIAVSPGLADRIAPLCAQPVRVVPNVVDDRFFRNELTRPEKEGFSFLSIGSLDKNKGMDAVLRAFAGARKLCPDIRLTIAGEGPEREALTALTEELCVADAVLFTGRVSRERCAGLYRECDAFVLASRVETFGLVLAEAMACGRPIIMTDTGARRELVTEDTGRYVNIDDIGALARAMAGIAGDPLRYDPGKIRAYCAERFSGRAVCGELTKIYEEILGRS